jgi:putative transposase
VTAARQRLGVSERRACRTLGQHRSVQRHAAKPRPDEDALTAEVVGLASLYGRYGYRRVTALLRRGG